MKLLLFIFILLFNFSSYANFTNEEINDAIIKNRNLAPAKKFEAYAKLFLGKPYVLSPLGEGDYDIYDKDPIYSFEMFDCTTYIETVYALYFSNNFQDFEKIIKDIRYSSSEVLFTARNHFPSTDWIANNVKKGYIIDITRKTFKENTKILTTTIDKSGWYNKMTISSIKDDSKTDSEKEKLLEGLQKQAGDKFKETISTNLDYVEISYILNNPSILDKIPSGTIVNIVRIDWPIKNLIGTDLDISHQGIVIKENGIAMFYNASTITNNVSKVPLIDYLKTTVNSKTIKGLNFLYIS